jgi:flagellar protein FlaG
VQSFSCRGGAAKGKCSFAAKVSRFSDDNNPEAEDFYRYGRKRMSIEMMASIAKTDVSSSDGLGLVAKQAVAGIQRQDAAETELPEKAVKPLTPAQEEEQLRDAAEKTNEFVKELSPKLQFSVDKDTGKTVVKVIDQQTEEVIRQIPPKEMLEIAKALDMLQGLIIRKKI